MDLETGYPLSSVWQILPLSYFIVNTDQEVPFNNDEEYPFWGEKWGRRQRTAKANRVKKGEGIYHYSMAEKKNRFWIWNSEIILFDNCLLWFVPTFHDEAGGR